MNTTEPTIAAPSAGTAEVNQRELAAALARIRAHLERAAAGAPVDAPAGEEVRTTCATLRFLAEVFGLSPFEQDVLLLCAGVELDARFADALAPLSHQGRTPLPTFSLALATLPGAHWSALTPDRPLRRWRLLDVGAGDTLVHSPLRIDECILHHLAGAGGRDERVRGCLRPAPHAHTLAPSHAAVARQVANRIAQPDPAPAVIHLATHSIPEAMAAAGAAAARLGAGMLWLHARDLPQDSTARDSLAMLCAREAILQQSFLGIACLDTDPPDTLRAVAAFMDALPCPVLVTGREAPGNLARPISVFHLPALPAAEQDELWRTALGDAATDLNGTLGEITAQFRLTADQIRRLAETLTLSKDPADEGLPRRLWDLCRIQSRARMEDLATRIEPRAGWADLVLPEAQHEVLRDLARHVRNRHRVHETWGFAARAARGLGITALFSGQSGTGKTLAAEVLAAELRLDLFRIDLSGVVSKYIGETEKNLRRVFDAAEAGGAILLFDEADALFGKRSEVKDSHDRYANLEISYLLQRMEAYRGLAILTTNQKDALDPAFLRRLRFIVQFPFPDAAQRAELWRRLFPPETPTEGLQVERLARLNLAGGHLRNVALHAAFRAAETGQPVRMCHLLAAAKAECAKLERPLTDAEIGGWIT